MQAPTCRGNPLWLPWVGKGRHPSTGSGTAGACPYKTGGGVGSEFLYEPHAGAVDVRPVASVGSLPEQLLAMSRFAALWRARPQPRCPACHKWNRVYVTGGSFLTHCVHCGAALEMRRPSAMFDVWRRASVRLFGRS